ncbi:MAG: response regulator [Planctomycetes bacterium]|nr:response regulator [Planctomycetota bacterium]
MSDAARILVVEDDGSIRRFLRATLPLHGYVAEEAATMQQAMVAVTSHPPDVVLLDLGLPDGDGIEFIRTVRGWSSVPILVLSAREQERDKVAALDAGADDYLTKPFGVDELLARIRVALRHAVRAASEEGAPFVSEIGGERLVVDLVARRVERAGAGGGSVAVPLTPTEFRLLAVLVRHAGKVLTHTLLLREVWGRAHEGDVAYLRVYVRQLRQKLEPLPAEPRWLVTELGVGYRLCTGD